MMPAFAAIPPADSRAPIALEVILDLARMPDRFIVHAATNNDNAPLICRGDIVVVDVGGPAVTGGWLPTDGGLFLIEYEGRSDSERYGRRYRSIVQTFLNQRGHWYAGALRRGMQGRKLICADGPYADEMALADKLIGKVVGLYRPSGVLQ